MKKFSYVSKKLLKDMGAGGGGGGDPTYPTGKTTVTFKGDGVKTLREIGKDVYDYLHNNNIVNDYYVTLVYNNLEITGYKQIAMSNFILYSFILPYRSGTDLLVGNFNLNSTGLYAGGYAIIGTETAYTPIDFNTVINANATAFKLTIATYN